MHYYLTSVRIRVTKAKNFKIMTTQPTVRRDDFYPTRKEWNYMTPRQRSLAEQSAIAIRNCGLNILLGWYSPLDWHRVIFNWGDIVIYDKSLFYDVDWFLENYGKQAIRPRVDVDRIPRKLVAELTYIVLVKRWELLGKRPSKREMSILINEWSGVDASKDVQKFIKFHSK